MFKSRKLATATCLLLATTALTGCLSRSISGKGGRSLHKQQAVLYGQELSEQDVLGLNNQHHISEAQIQHALDSSRNLAVPKGSRVMLVQSGARVPDPAMISSFDKDYDVTVFTGIANKANLGNNFSKALRLAAARAHSEKIVCLWGKVESATRKLETKVVSWIPIVGQIVPDKAQRMRIQLKIAVIDVRTGAWDVYSSKTFEDTSISAKISRESSDQGLIEDLKKEAYREAAKEFSARYSSKTTKS